MWNLRVTLCHLASSHCAIAACSQSTVSRTIGGITAHKVEFLFLLLLLPSFCYCIYVFMHCTDDHCEEPESLRFAILSWLLLLLWLLLYQSRPVSCCTLQRQGRRVVSEGAWWERGAGEISEQALALNEKCRPFCTFPSFFNHVASTLSFCAGMDWIGTWHRCCVIAMSIGLRTER